MKIGMGWLGWTEEQTLATTIPAIILAYEGRMDMLRSIFGGNKKQQPPPTTDVVKDVREEFRSAGLTVIKVKPKK